jgi:hypothetical protein
MWLHQKFVFVYNNQLPGNDVLKDCGDEYIYILITLNVCGLASRWHQAFCDLKYFEVKSHRFGQHMNTREGRQN